MPIIERPIDEHPEETDAALWRYMDLSQLVSILERGQLWFARADKLGDPYEGSLTQPRREIRDERIRGLKEFTESEEGWTPLDRDIDELIEEQVEKNKRQREWVFINCWHQNEKESAAMWDLYAKSNDAIVIKTTFERLVNALSNNEEEISLSQVRYLDFEEEDMVQGESTLDFLFKRKSFEYEREVRALFWDLPGVDEMDNQPPGHYVEIEIETLIDEIRIAPSAETWFFDTVKQMLGSYGFSEEIITQSNLAEDPLF